MAEEFDFSGFDNLDLSSLLGDSGGNSVSDIDFSGFDNLDISSLLGGGDQGIDFSKIAGDYGDDLAYDLARTLKSTGQASSLFSDDGGFSMDALFRNATDGGGVDLSSLDMGPEAFNVSDLSRSLASTDKDTTEGTGLGSTKGLGKLLTSTGRGQLSMVDPVTGATGITGEGFKSIEDLLGAGTAEEIARYTPGSTDFSLRSGLETEGGQGFNADSTRGMSLAQMGGGQGLSKYIPAQYRDGETTPIKGTGGTLSETGFLSQSSAANPLGSKYSLGDPRSFINNPTITGQQSVVSPGRTIIDNKDGTYKVVTNTIDGTKTITTNKDGVDKIIRETKTIDNTKANAGAKAAAADKKDNNMLMMLLALMALMNKGGGSSTSNAVIPSLSADRKQLPYGPASGSTARPGAGGVTYFSPTTYTKKAAGGGMMGGGLSDLGGYSDGGRLLRGPGDGVSDSIPATIGGKQPARLATGEFVVPARIVSELGNGSTEAGAQKLYSMMDRVQKARRKTKNVAADTKAHKYLPA